MKSSSSDMVVARLDVDGRAGVRDLFEVLGGGDVYLALVLDGG